MDFSVSVYWIIFSYVYEEGALASSLYSIRLLLLDGRTSVSCKVKSSGIYYTV